MSTPTDPVLYSFRRCPYAMRARLALGSGGVQYELREVKLSAKPAAMLEASGKGTVPVMVLPDRTVLDESLDIMRWALCRHDPEGWLQREDSGLIATCDGSFKHDLDRYKYPERHGSDPNVHRTNASEFLALLEERLGIANHLSGAARGMTDAAIMPFVRQFAAVEPAWFAALPLPRLQVWLADHLASALFGRIMTRHASWVEGDVPVIIEG